MSDFAWCEIELCPAAATGPDGLCSAHRGAKRAGHVMAGQRCAKCKRLLDKGDWITRESTASEMTHAVCPPKRPALSRKMERSKPLFDTLNAADRQGG